MSIASAPPPANPANVSTSHPRGLYLLFVTEMWERFSFYGMKAFLILYMTLALSVGGLEWTVEKAGAVYGWYAGLVYLTPIVGGWVADRVLGTHRSLVIGGAIIAAGHFTLAAMDVFETGSSGHIALFYGGLLLIIVGTGFFKPCVSVMVGQLYGERDPRRDAAFTIFYMGINLGAFLGPLVCGGLRLARQTDDGVFGWSWAFGAAGVGMVLGLAAYMIGRPFLLKGIGDRPRRKTPEEGAAHRAPMTREEKQQVAVIFIMAFFVIFFWTAFEQAGGSMNLFAEERTDRSLAPSVAEALYRFANDANYGIAWWLLSIIGLVPFAAWIGLLSSGKLRSNGRAALRIVMTILGLGVGAPLLVVGILKGTGFLGQLFPDSLLTDPQYPAEWFQSVNPLFILLLAPVFASLWVRLGRRGKEPSTPLKFALGLILLGGGFVFMVMGAQAAEGPDGSIAKVSAFWLLAAYCVNTMAELCLSPVGLSMVTKLSPVHFVSLLMGVWFLANFVANLAAGILTGYSEKIARTGFILDGLAGFFLVFVIAPVAAGVALLFLTPTLRRMMHDRA